jgi:hypothetical protein
VVTKPFDFRALLTAPLDPQLKMEDDDLAWAAYGRAVHKNLTSERYLTAVNTACLGASAATQPVHFIAASIRAYLIMGTIAR